MNQTICALEQSIIGEIIHGGEAVLLQAKEELLLDNFHFNEHKIIFEAADMLRELDKDISFENIYEALSSEPEILLYQYYDKIEADEVLGRIIDIVAALEEFEIKSDLINNISLLKNVELKNDSSEIDNSNEYTNRLNNEYSFYSIEETLNETIIELEREKEGEAVRYQTGIKGLDDIIRGLENGRLYVLGAEPKIGKSQFVLQLAYNVASQQFPVAIISLEMTRKELSRRFLAMNSNINIVNELNIEQLKNIKDNLRHLPIYIYDDSIGINELIQVVARLVKEKGIRVVFIDYLGLISAYSETKIKTDEVNIVVREIKDLAKTLNIPIFLIASLVVKQMYYHKRYDKTPTIADFRDSGQISYDADCILFLWNNSEDDDGYRQLTVSRSRYSRQGETITTYLNPETLTFSEPEAPQPPLIKKRPLVDITLKTMKTNISEILEKKDKARNEISEPTATPPVYNPEELFVNNPKYLKLWKYLLSKISHEKESFSLPVPRNTGLATETITLERGQVFFKRVKAAEDTGLSEQNVRTVIKNLSDKYNLINIVETGEFGTIVEILNWEKYQASSDLPQVEKSNFQLTKLNDTTMNETTNTEFIDTVSNLLTKYEILIDTEELQSKLEDIGSSYGENFSIKILEKILRWKKRKNRKIDDFMSYYEGALGKEWDKKESKKRRNRS